MSPPIPEADPRRWWLPGLLALGVLAVLAARHPELRFVDAIRFAERARALGRGEWLVDGLYPVGYPALLAAGRGLGVDVLAVAKALSVLAGAGLVAGIARALGTGAALWVGAQAGLLAWGSTEGTDLAAAALALSGVLAAAQGRSALAGGLVAAAVLCRYPAVAAAPVMLALAPARGRALAVLLAGTAPHWAVALATGASVLPQQELNLAIGAGGPAELWSTATLARWPTGVARATRAALVDLGAWVGAVGLLTGVARRDRRALALLGVAALHLGLLGLAFANPRLALPATLAFAAGAAWLVPARWLMAAAVGWGAWNLFAADAGDPAAEHVAPAVAVASALPGPCLTNNPWFHQRADGWLIGGVQLSGVAGPGIGPVGLVEQARARGLRCVALDAARLRGRHPGLEPLLRGPAAGLVPAGEAKGWAIYAVEP